jgi:hypothetical protein
MADMAGTIFTAVKALYTADTGGSGLNNAASANSVIHFFRRGDPNYDEDRMQTVTHIIVDIFCTESRTFGKRRTEALVRMHLFTPRDQNTSDFTLQNAIGERMYSVFDGVSMSDQGTIEFSVLNQVRDFQAASSGSDLHRVFEFTVQPFVETGV